MKPVLNSVSAGRRCKQLQGCLSGGGFKLVPTNREASERNRISEDLDFGFISEPHSYFYTI
jgi:hypothetical protein